MFSPLRAMRRFGEKLRDFGLVKLRRKPEELTMAWTTPEICEVCVGMEVTAYASAEI